MFNTEHCSTVRENGLVHLDRSSRGKIAPIALSQDQHLKGGHVSQRVVGFFTYQSVGRSIVVLETVFVLAFLTLSDKKLFTADTLQDVNTILRPTPGDTHCVAATKTVTSNSDNL